MAANDPYMVQPLRKQRTDTMGSLQSRTSSLVPVTTFGSGRLVWRLTSNPESYVVSEGRLDVAMHAFLAERKVHYTSIDPVRIGIVNESVAPIIILLLASGLSFPKTASRTSTSRYVNQWSLPLPRCTSNPTVEVREAFSTTLSIIICAERTAHIEELSHFSSLSLPCRRSSSSSQPNMSFSRR